MGRSMGTRQLNRLSAKTIAFKKHPGLYCDGGGLYLQVTPSGSKTWIFRFRSTLTRKLRDMGLGALHTVGLPEAREKAAAQRTALLDGLDPIEAREQEHRRKALEVQRPLPSRIARRPTSSPIKQAGGTRSMPNSGRKLLRPTPIR